MTENNAMEAIWMKAVVAYFEVLFRRLPQNTEENNEKLQSKSSRCPG
jgi:hypothetical protein